MKVTFFPATKGSKPVPLSDGIGNSEPLEGDRLTESGLSQKAMFLRGKSQKMFYRGNEGTRYEFTVARIFPTIGDAEYFRLTHRSNLRDDGDVRLETVTADGPNAIKTIPDAVVQATVSEGRGRSILVSYTIEGGAMI